MDSGTLLPTECGRPIQLSKATDFTITLPPAGDCPSGSAIILVNSNAGVATIERAGDTSNKIVLGNWIGFSVPMGKGDHLILVSNTTDWYGISGSVMMTYSGTFLDYVQNNTGEIAFFAKNTAPTGWLKANGAAVSRTTYADLYTAIGTTFGVGDGSTTFNLPDLRGEFIRGWDDSRGVDSGRVFGSTQADEFKSHTHDITTYDQETGSNNYVVGKASGTLNTMVTLATGGTETRPRNIALLACIRYKR